MHTTLVIPLTAYPAIAGGAAKTNSEGGESFLLSRRFWHPQSLQRTIIRVRSTPGAGRFIDAVALECVGTAMSDDSRRLLRQILRRKNNFGFQGNLVSYMFTMKHLAYKPLLLSHTHLQITTSYNDKQKTPASDRRHGFG